MSKCQGLPDGPCPHNVRGSKVKFSQGDLMLCPHCKDIRFGNNSNNKTAPDNATAEASTSVSALGSGDNATRDDVSQDIVTLQPLLTYVIFSSHRGSQDKIRNVILGHFTTEQIVEAKDVLWAKADESIIGEKKKRIDSTGRTVKEAHTEDIITALAKLDKAEKVPLFAIDAYSLGLIPRIYPEEINNISLAERMNSLEKRMSDMSEIIENTVCQNIHIREQIDAMKKPPTFADVASLHVALPPCGARPTGSNTTRMVPSEAIPNSNKPMTAIGTSAGTRENVVMNSTTNVNATSEGTSRSTNYLVPPPGRGRSRGSGRGRGRGRGRGDFMSMFNHAASDVSFDRNSTASHRSRASQFRDKSHDDWNDDDWNIPPYFRKKNNRQERRRQKTITGKTSGSGRFKGAPEPSRDLFIARVDSDTTDNDLTEYLTEKAVTIRDLKCTSHPNSRFKSFKLTIPLSNLSDLLDENFWPDGVQVRKFIPPSTTIERW